MNNTAIKGGRKHRHIPPCKGIIQYLNKNTWRHRGGGGYKYFVNCDHLAQHPDLLQLQQFLYYKDHIAILHAIATDDQITDRQKEVIIKIDYRHDTVQTEYKMGEIIFKHHIPGFIRYICVFSCYDTSNKDILRVEASRTLKRTLTFPTKQYLPTHICQAEPNEGNKENVLIMPYFPDGSIENYAWTEDNIRQLPNLLIHIVLSLAVAFDKIKFVHNDLHLGNILLKPTTKKEISYAFSTGTSTGMSTHRTTTSKRNTQNRTRKQRNVHSNVRIQRYPVLGIQPIIMDFGKASCEQTRKDVPDVDNRDFWENILFLCQNIETLRKPKQYYIEWEWDDIKTYIRNAIREDMPCTAVVPLLRTIEQSTFRYVDTSRVKTPAYNPDIL